MQIPKFIKDIRKYFMYEGSAAPTTQDDLQAFIKNEHETLECLVDGLWQPETEYQAGHVVKSPNMPKGIEARVKTGGYSAANEPDWKVSATEISDGSVVWEKIARFNNIEVTGDVTGSGAVDNDGQVALNLELPDKVTAGTVGDTAAANLGNGATFTVPYLTVDEKGRVTDYDKRDLTLPTVFNEKSNFTVTASTETTWSGGPAAAGGRGSVLTKVTGIVAGTYTLQNLLQQLVHKSHTHGSQGFGSTGTPSYNCNCECSTDGCIIDGMILTEIGYIPIQKLKAGDKIVYGGDSHKVMGIKKNICGTRKAVSLKSNFKLVLTDDHLFLIRDGYGSYDIAGYLRESSRELTDGKVHGTYAREEKKSISNLSCEEAEFLVNEEYRKDIVIENESYGATAVTYTPIVEGCEWCIVEGVVVACAKYLRGEGDA